MSESLLLAVDQGTTNTKILATTADGARRWSGTARTPITFPRPGWVESDPDEVWRSVLDALAACTAQLPAEPIAAIAISNQRESVVAWDRNSGEPLGPLVSWQCGRSVELCRALLEAGHAGLVERVTGLRLDPMFSATKMRWLLDTIPHGAERAASGELCVGTVDAWLLWKFTAGAVFATDATNASRTLLMDLATCEWSREMLDLFGIPRACLPDIRPSVADYGEARLALDGGTVAIPIRGVAGDSHAALVGHGALGPGIVKATFGTGTSVMTPVRRQPAAGDLSATVGYALGEPGDVVPTYALEGNIYATGAALEWTAGLLGIDVGALDQLAAACESSGGVHLVPAFAGLGAPHWQPTARGAIGGLTRGSGRPEVARAAFEAVAHQVSDVIDAMRPAVAIDEIRADGGALRSAHLAGVVADLTGVPVIRRDESEVACLGAIALAATGAGLWDGLEDVERLALPSTRFEPALATDARVEQRARWNAQLRLVMSAAPS